MKRVPEFVCSLDQPWRDFSRAWDQARQHASVKSVHSLRVNARRLIANLELAEVLDKGSNLVKLKQRLKKVLKGMGPLRDVQVALRTLPQARRSAPIVDFTRRLKRLEKEEIKSVPKKLKRRKKDRLSEAFQDVRTEVARRQTNLGVDRVHDSIRPILASRRNELLKAKKRFYRSAAGREEALHEMRIALKKLRYIMEAAHPLLSESEKEKVSEMRGFQRLMGDSRDAELVRSELERWAKKKGKKLAVVPALDQLAERRQVLLGKLLESSDRLESILAPASTVPTAEKTQITPPLIAAAAVASSSRR